MTGKELLIILLVVLLGCTIAGVKQYAAPAKKVHTYTIEQVKQRLESRYKVKAPTSELLATAIVRAVEKEGGSVDTTLAQIHVETSYSAYSVSHKGAVGYMQVMPKYWSNNKACPYSVYDRYENVFLGVCIMHQYTLQFGNEADALVAYNIGPSSIEDLAAGIRYRNKVLKEVGDMK